MSIWAMDLEDGQPIRAHQVVTADGDRRTLACGQVRGPVHPCGWWESDGPPLQDHAVHCVEATPALGVAALAVLSEWDRMHPSGHLAMYAAMDSLRRAVRGQREGA